MSTPSLCLNAGRGSVNDVNEECIHALKPNLVPNRNTQRNALKRTGETNAHPTHAHTKTQMWSRPSSRNCRKAPPEACLTNTALILTWQGPRLSPLTSLPEGDPSPPSCVALSFYCTPESSSPARTGTQHTLNPQPGEVGRGAAVQRGTRNVWTQSPAHDRPAKLSHTHHGGCTQTHTHTHTSAFIHQ